MARIRRMLVSDQATVYHLVSRTALEGTPLGEGEKQHLLQVITHFAQLYHLDVLGFCIMGDHFHLLVKVFPQKTLSNEVLLKRIHRFYPAKTEVEPEQLQLLHNKYCSLFEFVKEVKQSFTRRYNREKREPDFFGDNVLRA